MESAYDNIRLRLNTQDIPVDRRVDTWQSVMWNLCSPMACETDLGDDFSARVVAEEFGSLGFRHMWSDAYKGEQTRQTLARARRDRYVLTIPTSGWFAMSQFGRELTADSETILLHSTMDEFKTIHTQPASAFLMTIPAARLKDRIAIPEEFCAMPLRRTSPATSIFLASLHSTIQQLGRLDDILRASLAERLIDLLAVAIESELTPHSQTSSVRAGHLRRIKAYINANHHRADLSAKTVAAAFDLSVRYIHDLFKTEPMTIGAFLREQRLQRVRNTLGDPRFSTLTISEIAFQHGFHSNSHFTTCFKEAFGCTPRAWRCRHLAANGRQ